MPLAVRAARVGTPSLRSIAYGRLAVRFGSDDGLAGPALQRVERIDGADDGIAVLFGQAVGVRPVLLFPGGPEQSAAGEVVDSAPAHLHGDVVVVRAGRHVRVEGGRRRVVEAHAGDHADLAPLFAGSDDIGRKRSPVRRPAHHAGVGFAPRRERGSRRRRIGDIRIQRPGGSQPDGFESVEQLRFSAEFRSEADLRSPHSIPDEEENVFRFFETGRRSGNGQQCGADRREQSKLFHRFHLIWF